MKVTDIKTYIVDAFRTNYIFLKVMTDEGISGYAEATLEYREQSVVAAIEEIKAYLVGRDPMEAELHHLHMERDTYWRYGPVLSSAMSGVDTALWDIKGKALGVPVYSLLGGRVHDKLDVYLNAWFSGAKSKEEFAQKASEAVQKGFSALKWDPFGKSYLTLSKKEMYNTMELIGAVREAVGPKADLLIEGHGRFNVPTAVQIAKELARFGVYWFEEPIHPGRNDLLLKVKEQSPVPIAAGERAYSRFEAAELIQSGAVDFIQPDVSHVGGVTELKKIAAIADANYIVISPHNPMGPAANAATMQVMTSCANFHYLETMITDVPWRRELVSESCYFKDGGLAVTDQPGLGIEFNEEMFGRHPYKAHELRHYQGTLTDIRPPDEIIWFK